MFQRFGVSAYGEISVEFLSCLVGLMPRVNAWLKSWIQIFGIDLGLVSCTLDHCAWTPRYARTSKPHELLSSVARDDNYSQFQE